MEHLETLRLEALEEIDEQELLDHAQRWGKEKIRRAADAMVRLKQRLDEEVRES